MVNLVNWRCSCEVWELSGMPCVHAITCAIHKGRFIEKLFASCFYRTTYLQSYMYIIHPVPNHPTLLTSNFDPLKPPIIRRLTRIHKMRSMDPIVEHYIVSSVKKMLIMQEVARVLPQGILHLGHIMLGMHLFIYRYLFTLYLVSVI